MSTELAHIPVLLNESVEGLVVDPAGIYLDGTFGRGGHSAALLERLDDAGRLYAIDQDVAAIEVAQARFADESRFAIRHGCFDELTQFCQDWQVAGKVDGILLDIGVSSPQLDDPERGFSFQSDGPLDMRMNQTQGVSAAQWLATAEETEIADVIWRYGEERNSRRIARRIVERREEAPIETTKQLADLIDSATRVRDRKKHPATRSFQAIRIHVNRELEVLEAALESAFEVLAPGGRLAVISFHSLEDRMVKRFMREKSQGKPIARGLPVSDEDRGIVMRLIGKATKPGEQELLDNPRARSSVLRIAQKL